MKRNQLSIIFMMLLCTYISKAETATLDDTAYNANPVQAIASVPSALFGGHPFDSAKDRQKRADQKNKKKNNSKNTSKKKSNNKKQQKSKGKKDISTKDLDDTKYNTNPVQAIASVPSALFGGHPFDSAQDRQDRADKKNKKNKKTNTKKKTNTSARSKSKKSDNNAQSSKMLDA